MQQMIAKLFKAAVVVLFILGLAATGVLGTETRLLFYWPGVFLLGAAALLVIFAGRWQLLSAPSDLCLTTSLVLGGYILFRALLSPVAVFAREDIFLLAGCAVVYTLTATAFSHPRLRMALLTVLLLLTVGNLAVGFIHFSGSWTFHIVPSYMRSFGEGQRIGGFFNNPNHLAAFLSAMALFFFGVVLFGRSSAAARLMLGFVALASAIGVALTISRGALVGLGAGGLTLAVLAVLIVCKTHPYLMWKLLVGTCILAALGSLVLYGVFSEQLQTRFGGNAFGQGDPRPLIWAAALAQHGTQPILGAGSRMFYEGCITYRTADSPGWMKEAQFVHNDWLQMLSEYGWVGVLILVGMLLAHFASAWAFLRWFVTERFPRSASITSRNLGLTVGAMAALVALLVHAIFDFHFHVPATALTAALLLGILANPGTSNSENPPVKIPGVRAVLKYAITIAGLCMMVGAVQYGRADYFAEKAEKQPDGDDMGLARISWLTKAIEVDPHNATTWYNRGLARFDSASGEPAALATPMLKSSLEDLTQARDLNPYNLYIALAVADVHGAAGEHDAERRAIEEAYHLAPLYQAPRLALALYHHRLKHWPEAERAYLWAADARAEGDMEWYALYRQMLDSAAKE